MTCACVPGDNPYGYPECGTRTDDHHCRLERDHLGPHQCYHCRILWLLVSDVTFRRCSP